MKLMRWKATGRAVVIAVAFAGIMSCGNNGSDKGKDVAEEEIPVVEVAQVFAEEVPYTSIYTSTVQAFVKNNIAPQTVGRIAEVRVETGDFVKAGQIVAKMDDATLLQSRLKMVNDSTELSRLKELYEAGGLSKSDFDAIELAYNVSRTNYENLLENTVLVSPVDGVISARYYDQGDMFTMGQPIYVVEQIVPVKLLAGISEVDYTKVHPGDEVEISADAFPGRNFKGSIRRIYPTVDPMTHTFKVEIAVPNKDKALRPGMFVRVKVSFGSGHHVVVPDQAVVKQTGSGERFIYVLQPDGTVRFQKVELGKRMESEYEILSGVEDGEKVVTKGQVRLRSGIRVKVVE